MNGLRLWKKKNNLAKEMVFIKNTPLSCDDRGPMSDKSFISPAAIVHPTAKIADDVAIGPWVVIGEHVEIGSGSRIDAHAMVVKNTIMGKNNHIHSHAVIGGDSQDLKYKGEESWLIMGDGNIVREFATINRGSDGVSNTTVVGNGNSFFSYSHVAHDARIGNGVLFVNNAGVSGHVTVDDFAIIGAYAAVHQFTRIGSYSFLVHVAKAVQDIQPFMLVKGTPGIPFALNLVGLRRHGFSTKTIGGLKKAYRLMYRDGLSLVELESALVELAEETPEINMIIDIMKNSERGIVRKQIARLSEEIA